MGLHYFEPHDPTKNPTEPRVHLTYSNKTVLDNQTIDTMDDQTLWLTYGEAIMTIFFNHLATFGLFLNLFGFSMLWVSLTTRQLVSFYTYLIAFATVPLSYLLNTLTVNQIVARDSTLSEKPLIPISLFFGKYCIF